jgi:hypothetical protein
MVKKINMEIAAKTPISAKGIRNPDGSLNDDAIKRSLINSEMTTKSRRQTALNKVIF